ncbi:outer membrane lipoprotein carrier protein LolA [Pseudoalteromonas sp.]|uniref:outer membrane lipoprotein carrier protein LolA n=1 Tax=Pseudoalteromonas sp. TaxID=53249 RepID=UPI0035649420
MALFKYLLICVSILIVSGVNASAIEGEFKQFKQFAGFAEPFVSTGVFSLHQEKLIWQVQTPVQNTLVVENGQVLIENSQGELRPQPGSEQFVGLLTDLLRVDMNALAARFNIEAQQECLLLTPKDTLLQQLFSYFKLCQSQQVVSSITLYEHSGSKTTIEFSYPETPVL